MIEALGWPLLKLICSITSTVYDPLYMKRRVIKPFISQELVPFVTFSLSQSTYLQLTL